jgi:hypothetical protein
MADIANKEQMAGLETPAQPPEALPGPAVSGRRSGPALATSPLPAHIRVSNARLPPTYEQAKTALAQCSRIDECQEWADKAEALASYARQADDDSLRKLADRIQARAIRRCGELLKTFNTGPDGGRPKENGEGTHTVSQRAAAEQAGLSKHQQVTAVRVANVPTDQFEQTVESDMPPTVTKLAEMGKQPQPAPPAPPSPSPPAAAAPSSPPEASPVTAADGLKQAMYLTGVVRDFADFCQQNDPVLVAGGLMKSEIQEVRGFVGIIDSWLDRFVVNLPSDTQS